MKTRLLSPVDSEPANGTGTETDGSDVYEAATEVDTTQAEPGAVPETDVSQTPHTDEAVDKKTAAQNPDDEQLTPEQNQAKIVAEGAAAAKTGVQPSDDERIAKIATAVVAAAQPRQSAPAAPQEPQLTDEQVRNLLNPIEVTPDLLRNFGIENASPEQVGAYQQFANGIVKNAVSVANLLVEQKLRENLAPYQPYVDFVANQQAQQHNSEFYKEHGDLQKYEKFVQLAAQQISPFKADKSMKSAKEVYTEVATSVRGMLAQAGVTLQSPSANPSAVAKPGSAVPRMAALASTGRSQGGQPSGEQNNPDADIYT